MWGNLYRVDHPIGKNADNAAVEQHLGDVTDPPRANVVEISKA